ncbi:MAG: TetR/AcrR family transcriptional regulator, partial [Burkholderiaceae bacterium]|nr:TetR/AcrR family transcriptional regulator [Burkholderiaceae bacterium]
DPEPRLRELILRFVAEYAHAQDAHRVLTEDVRYLDAEERARVLGAERRVVDAFADAVAAVRPGASAAALDKPLAMLLFGMINWMFTWIKPEGRLSYDDMAPVVCDLFFGGVGAVQLSQSGRRAHSTIVA